MQQTRKPYVFSDLHNDVMKENIPVWISIVDRIKDRGTWAGMVMILKLWQGNKEQTSVSTAFYIGKSHCGSNCLQRL